MIVVRAGERAAKIATLLREAGAGKIRRYAQRDRAWTKLSGPETQRSAACELALEGT